jgi:hypothetical protein
MQQLQVKMAKRVGERRSSSVLDSIEVAGTVAENRLPLSDLPVK